MTRTSAVETGAIITDPTRSVLDRLAIGELLSSFASALDRRSIDDALACFGTSPRWTEGDNEHIGRAKIRRWLAREVRETAPGTVRTTANIVVKVDGDAATAESVLVEYSGPRSDGTQRTRCLRVVDVLTRTARGWVITHHRSSIAWTQDSPRSDQPPTGPEGRRDVQGSTGGTSRITHDTVKSMGRSLWKCVEVTRRRSLEAMAEAGYRDLGPAQLHLLSICTTEGDRPSDLARKNQMSPQALNYLLSSMEKTGYLHRAASHDGSPRRVVRLTEKGEKALAIASEAGRETENYLRRTIGPDAFHGFELAMEAFAEVWVEGCASGRDQSGDAKTASNSSRHHDSI